MFIFHVTASFYKLFSRCRDQSLLPSLQFRNLTPGRPITDSSALLPSETSFSEGGSVRSVANTD